MAENDKSLESDRSFRRVTRRSQEAEKSLVDDAPTSTAKRKDRSTSFQDALETLSRVDHQTKVRGSIKIGLAVEAVVSHAMEFGVEPSHLETLVMIVVRRDSKLTQTIKGKLVKCMVPASYVPEAVVLRAICFISQRIFVSPGPSTLEALLMRWILLILDYVDSYSKLHHIYGLIFNFVHSEKLLPHACHLLFRLTRKDDVKLFRVEQLTDIIKKVGPQPPLIGLLTCYKMFNPYLVTVRLHCSHKSFFKPTDQIWRSTITSINQKNDFQREKLRQEGFNRGETDQQLSAVPAKRLKQMIPRVHGAAREHEEETQTDDATIPFEQVGSFVHFVEVIEKIQYPSQIAAVLTEPNLQLLLKCDPDPVIITRLCMWIHHFFVFSFDQKTREADGEDETVNALLKLLYQFCDQVQSLPVVHGFLTNYLPRWDGKNYIPVIFSLISTIHPCSYEELYETILNPLFQLFFTSDVYFKGMCVMTMTDLIDKYVTHMASLQSSKNNESTSFLTSMNEKSRAEGASQSDNMELPDQSTTTEQELLVCQECVERLVRYLDVVLVVAMEQEKDNVLFHHITLSLLEKVSNIFKGYKVPILCLPVRIMYRLLLSDCPAAVARLCGVINKYRENITALRNHCKENEDSCCAPSFPNTSTVNNTCLSVALSNTDPSLFNSLLVDMLKMLWHGTMFAPSKSLQYKSVFQFELPKPLDERLNSKCMTLYKAPTFAGLAYKFLKEIHTQEGIVLKPTMIEMLKNRYLDFLARENFPQFKQFVDMNLKSRQGRTVSSSS